MTDTDPTQRRLVAQLIDWEAVQRRLERFPAIRGSFPFHRLTAHAGSPPYYCHYMAWRLGTWSDETFFARLDQLLAGSEALPNWSEHAAMLTSADFAEFWSLIWELQVAEYLGRTGTDVRWGASGPDLSVHVESDQWFVECYVYRKSFGLLLFIEELLAQIDPAIRVDYDWCLPFSLPKDGERSGFLDRILRPFQDAEFLRDARDRAAVEYPVVLYEDSSGLVIYIEGAGSYTPGRLRMKTGDPQGYLQVALTEALNGKKGANALATHRPNLLAVNYALSNDFQIATALRPSLPIVGLGPNIDAMAVAATGIDERLEHETFRRVAPATTPHSTLDAITETM